MVEKTVEKHQQNICYKPKMKQGCLGLSRLGKRLMRGLQFIDSESIDYIIPNP